MSHRLHVGCWGTPEKTRWKTNATPKKEPETEADCFLAVPNLTLSTLKKRKKEKKKRITSDALPLFLCRNYHKDIIANTQDNHHLQFTNCSLSFRSFFFFTLFYRFVFNSPKTVPHPRQCV